MRCPSGSILQCCESVTVLVYISIFEQFVFFACSIYTSCTILFNIKNEIIKFRQRTESLFCETVLVIKFDTAIKLSLCALLSLKINHSNQLTTTFDLLVSWVLLFQMVTLTRC